MPADTVSGWPSGLAGQLDQDFSVRNHVIPLDVEMFPETGFIEVRLLLGMMSACPCSACQQQRGKQTPSTGSRRHSSKPPP